MSNEEAIKKLRELKQDVSIPVPYAFQSQSLAFVKRRKHSIVAHEPGLGKTRIAIEAAVLPALIVCPASVRNHWIAEIAKWRPEESIGWGMFSVISYTDPDLFLMNPRHYNTLIVDEVHYIKSPTAKRTALVCTLIRAMQEKGEKRRTSGRTIMLSGTLVPNRPIELWPLLYAMRVTDMGYEDFAYRYADAYVDEFGQLDVRGESNLGELNLMVLPHCIRFMKEDVLDQLPSKTYRVLALDLPLGEGEKTYSVGTLRDLVRTQVPPMEVMSLILAEQGRRKLPQVVEHCRLALEEEKKIVVFAHHREMIEGICDKLCEHRPVRLWGGMTDEEKHQNIQSFVHVPGVRVFVGQIQAAGVGIDGLQHECSRVIFAEGSWVPSDITQASDRVHRIGQTKPVLVDLLTISGSIDEHMLRRTLEKQKIVDQIVPKTPFEVGN